MVVKLAVTLIKILLMIIRAVNDVVLEFSAHFKEAFCHLK